MTVNLDSQAIQRFEQEEVWQRGYEDNPDWVAKHRIMEAIIPAGVESILDVGCGNGSQGRLLARHYAVVGIDRSEMALRQTGLTCLQAWSHWLPVASKSFDAAWASQLFEHLPDDVLANTIAEMQRVARKWLLISVPYREDLKYRQCKCHACGTLYHVYGHLQCFDLTRLRHAMEPCVLQAWAFCGPTARTYRPFLLRVRQVLGRKWFSLPSAHPLCPRCGHSNNQIWHGNQIARWCDRLDARYSLRQALPAAYWIVALWKVAELQ